MGTCFSCVTSRGRKKIRIIPRGFTSFNRKSTSKESSKNIKRARRSSEEYPVERASGFFSFGSDISGLCIGAEADEDHRQKLGRQVQVKETDELGGRKESRTKSLKPTKERRRETQLELPKERKESPARPVTADGHQRKKSPARPITADGHRRKKTPARPITADGHQRKESPARPITADGPRRSHSNTYAGQERVKRTPVFKHSGPLDQESLRRNSLDRKPSKKNSVDRRGAEELSGDTSKGSKEDQSVDRNNAERMATVVQALNRKGRESVESARGLTTEQANGIKSRRPMAADENPGHLLPTDSDPSVPTDFDFIMKGSVKKNSKGLSPVWKSGDVSLLGDKREAAVSSSGRKDPWTRPAVEEAYKESAAKAAARDRNTFKSIGTDEHSFSSSSSVPGDSQERSSGLRPRKVNRIRSKSRLLQEVELESSSSLSSNSDIMYRSSRSPLEEPELRTGSFSSIRQKMTNGSRSTNLPAEAQPETATIPIARPRKSGSLVADPEPDNYTYFSAKQTKPSDGRVGNDLRGPEFKSKRSPSAKPKNPSSSEFRAEPEREIIELPASLEALLKDAAGENLKQRTRNLSLPKTPNVATKGSYPALVTNKDNISNGSRRGESPRVTRHAPLSLDVTGLEMPE